MSKDTTKYMNTSISKDVSKNIKNNINKDARENVNNMRDGNNDISSKKKKEKREVSTKGRGGSDNYIVTDRKTKSPETQPSRIKFAPNVTDSCPRSDARFQPVFSNLE